MQIYVSTFRLENYPVRAEDILHTGVEAFAAALNTVNIGKFNLCTCSIGMVEHAFYEAITHAQNRILYGNPVTDFAHVRANFVDSYARIVAMKLFSQRSVDYLRSASLEDRRYLLFNPVTKAKVTMEGETIMRALHDVVAAKGYEKNTMFREVAQLIGALPRLEGTVHVNVGLVLKFMPNYMLNPKEYPEIPTRNDPPTMSSSGSRDRRAVRAKSSSPTGRRPTNSTAASRTSPGSTSRRRPSGSSSSPPPPTPTSRRIWISCSTSAICSR